MTERCRELLAWRDDAKAELDRLQLELSDLQRRADDAQAKVTLMDKLIALERGDVTESDKRRPDDLLDACETILAEAGHPMHIAALHDALIERGVPIPGKGAQVNVIARLQRSDGRFVRTGRGVYGLASAGHAEVKPTRQLRRAKRK